MIFFAIDQCLVLACEGQWDNNFNSYYIRYYSDKANDQLCSEREPVSLLKKQLLVKFRKCSLYEKLMIYYITGKRDKGMKNKQFTEEQVAK